MSLEVGDISGMGAIATAAKGMVDRIWPDKTEVEKAKLAAIMQDSMNEFNLVAGQLEINKVEAASTNWFVAGWRPFIGWICGAGLGYQFLFMPIMNGIIKAIWHTAPFAALDVATLVSCVSGLLGLGTLRSVEKVKDAESKR